MLLYYNLSEAAEPRSLPRLMSGREEGSDEEGAGNGQAPLCLLRCSLLSQPPESQAVIDPDKPSPPSPGAARERHGVRGALATWGAVQGHLPRVWHLAPRGGQQGLRLCIQEVRAHVRRGRGVCPTCSGCRSPLKASSWS